MERRPGSSCWAGGGVAEEVLAGSSAASAGGNAGLSHKEVSADAAGAAETQERAVAAIAAIASWSRRGAVYTRYSLDRNSAQGWEDGVSAGTAAETNVRGVTRKTADAPAGLERAIGHGDKRGPARGAIARADGSTVRPTQSTRSNTKAYNARRPHGIQYWK